MGFWSATAPFGMPTGVYWAVAVTLVVLATLRLTRLVVVDSLGAWLWGNWAEMVAETRELEFREEAQAFLDTKPAPQEGKAKAAALAAIEDPAPRTFVGRLLSGLQCPYCVGFWVGLAVIVLTLWLQAVPIAASLWFIVLAALGLNYIVGHVVERLDG